MSTRKFNVGGQSFDLVTDHSNKLQRKGLYDVKNGSYQNDLLIKLT